MDDEGGIFPTISIRIASRHARLQLTDMLAIFIVRQLRPQIPKEKPARRTRRLILHVTS